MIQAALRLRDGLGSGRIWLGSVVKHLQLALIEAGHPMEADGKFGAGTEKAVKAFQKANRLPETGVVDKSTWAALSAHLQVAMAPRRKLIAELLNRFEGDLDWVHEQEGHVGKPYWPGGASGVTLDPGVDLGHADRALIERLYQPLLTPEQYAATQRVFGITGEEARTAINADPNLQGVRISREQAEDIMPYTARPYWDGIVSRFPPLARPDTPAAVQTVLLSLAYNRGTHNRDLEPLQTSLDAKEWRDVANKVGAMQQDHRLEGIRVRRRREADLILAELEYIQSQ